SARPAGCAGRDGGAEVRRVHEPRRPGELTKSSSSSINTNAAALVRNRGHRKPLRRDDAAAAVLALAGGLALGLELAQVGIEVHLDRVPRGLHVALLQRLAPLADLPPHLLAGRERALALEQVGDPF